MLVEYALVLPLAILLSIGLTDLGRLFWTLQDAYRVTAQVARCGAVDMTNKCTDLANYAESIDFPMAAVTYAATITSCGQQPAGYAQPSILVTANINFEFMIYGPSNLKNWTVSTCYSKSS